MSSDVTTNLIRWFWDAVQSAAEAPHPPTMKEADCALTVGYFSWDGRPYAAGDASAAAPTTASSSSSSSPSSPETNNVTLCRGMKATRNITKGELVMSIPPMLCLHLRRAFDDCPLLVEMRKLVQRYIATYRPPSTHPSKGTEEDDEEDDDFDEEEETVVTQAVAAAAGARAAGSTETAATCADYIDDEETWMALYLIVLRYGRANKLNAGEEEEDDDDVHPAGGYFFDPYVRFLPEEGDMTQPEFWDASHIEALQFRERREKVQRLQQKRMTKYDEVMVRGLGRALACTSRDALLEVTKARLEAMKSAAAAKPEGDEDAEDPLAARWARLQWIADAFAAFYPTDTGSAPVANERSRQPLITYRRWLWAVAILASRTFSLDTEAGDLFGPNDDATETTDTDGADKAYGLPVPSFTMIPFADLLNHDGTKGIESFGVEFLPTTTPPDASDVASGSESATAGEVLSSSWRFQFRATRDYAVGEQVYLYYNGLDYWHFVKSYGFVPAFPAYGNGAAQDEAPIDASNDDDAQELPRSSPNRGRKHAGAMGHGSGSRALGGQQQNRSFRVNFIDRFPVRVTPPSAVASVDRDDFVIDITRTQLFQQQQQQNGGMPASMLQDGGSQADFFHGTHVTACGPNSKLLAVCRLRELSAADFRTTPYDDTTGTAGIRSSTSGGGGIVDYTKAFNKPMLSVLNEVHAYRYLRCLTQRSLSERITTTPAGGNAADVMSLIAQDVSRRDREVLEGAMESTGRVYATLLQLYEAQTAQ